MIERGGRIRLMIEPRRLAVADFDPPSRSLVTSNAGLSQSPCIRSALFQEYVFVDHFVDFETAKYPSAWPQSQGISEAWITSATPSPPTERMARSTSSNPKRWVVISSSGKRLEASWAKASSQAL